MPSSKLTWGEILRFYYPLALTGMLVTASQPIINAGMARMPNPEISLAAYSVAFGVFIMLQSPILMFLQLSVVLARDGRSFLMVRNFVLIMASIIVGLISLVAYTPFNNIIFSKIMGVPPDILKPSIRTFQMMIFLPLIFSWRFLHQGVIIRYGRNILMTLATAVRVIVCVGIIFIGGRYLKVEGAFLGACSFVAGAITESAIVYISALPNIRDRLRYEPQCKDKLTYADITSFYLPLVLTLLMLNVTIPAINASIARVAQPKLSLAGFGVAVSIIFMLMSPARMLQQVVLLMIRDKKSYFTVLRFVLLVGGIFSTILAIISFSPLISIFLSKVMGVGNEIEEFAKLGVRFMILLPFISSWAIFFQGILLKRERTKHIRTAMFVRMLSLIIILLLGVWYGRINGVLLAAGASTITALVEASMLWIGARGLISRQFRGETSF